MYKYFLTSELTSYFVSCDAINIVDVDGKVEVFIDLDFLKNSETDIEKTIEDIIIKKSGRLVKNDKLYLLIQGFLVDVKNEKTTLETIDVPRPVVLPDRDTYLTKVEWSNWSECSRSCGEGIQKRTRNCTEFDIKNHLCDGNEYNEQACQINPCPALLRAHISLMIDNIEFHDALKDNSSDDFQSIAKLLCNEMYKYFLTSELASHFVSCDVINIVDVDGKVGVFFDLDFLKNSQTDSEKTIEDIIIKKSGRLVKNGQLYLLIQDFLVDVKSKKTTLETVYVPGPVELPDRHTYLTKVEWSAWSECSRSCGEGIQTRFRYCSDFDMQHQLCDRNKDEQICQHDPCPVEGKWAEWNNWEKCSMSCGQGVKTRRRECNNPSPSFGGQICIGVNIDNENCQERDCPIDGNWSEWNVWTDCSLSCDGGIKTRLRTCSNPEPKFGGKGCNGNEEESTKCGVEFCPVDGGWTEWTGWSECSVSCGIGTQDRMRTCSGPEPKYGGQNCTGNNLDYKTCDSIPCPIHGEWSEWSDWTGCSVTCGSGIKERQRPCNNPQPKFGGKDCSGDRIDHKECNGKSCPVDGEWTNWSEWSTCSHLCGGGVMFRNRTCTEPRYNGDKCRGNNTEFQECAQIPCAVDGQWSEWSKWSECTIPCGRGYRLRNRSCTEPSPQFGGELCHGNETETDICNINDCPVDGNWSPWGNWQECSTTCGGGTKTRNRTCTDPVPHFGGKYCHGNNTEAAICNNILCPIDGNWSHWSKWQLCSVSCGGGNQTRNRTCNNPEPQLGGEYCDGNDSEDIACNKMACPIDGIWSNWNEWTACSLSCGSGIQSRNRTCNDPEPQYGGIYCSGNNTEEQRCKEDPCPIDGNWSDWSTWGICTVSCGDGSKTRDRTCTNPIPQNGGLDCTGNETDVGFCNYSSCAINGNWTEWSDWSECNVSCGGGIQAKYRNCSNPVPEFGGEDCFGNNTEISYCNSKYCPIDGSWSTWSYWGNCSLSCGGGSKSRNRSCTDPVPNYGGDDCYGNSTETGSCNETPCPIDGSWTTWSTWNECSVSCGGGILYRNRSCSNPDPQYGGKDCIDNATDTKSCNDNNCPIEGSWTNWSEWSICSESCGGGLMLRNRTCSDPEPLFGGDDCIGNSTEDYHCNDNGCPVDGNWTDWSVWSTCSHSCGKGFQSRNRTCSNPVPQFGGNECLGNGTEDVMCNEHHCPVDGNWTKWTEWDNCTQSCGGGVRSRLRICSDPEPRFGGENCVGNSTERNICNDHNCQVDGNWTDWSEWSSCSDTCGGGLKLRYRNCSNPEPQFGGIDCLGNITEIDSCNDQYCPVDGSWSEWSEWNNCTYLCGGGLQFRNRTCSDPEPQFGGKDCIGNSTDNNLCNEHQCPVDGSWTEWSEWNNCTDVCGGGLKSRNRTCSDPEPNLGGKDCIGNNTHTILCNEHHCPVDGNWSEWSEWEDCSVTCGGGLKTRNRTCTNPASKYGGKDCSGNSTNISNCADKACPINGNWTEWSSWNECSVICGGGIKVRDRNCSNPVPQYGGDQCFGNATSSDTCNEQPCPIDGNWSGWSEWEECSITCGGGLKTRNRTCSNPAPQFRGKHCFGNDTLISNCANNPCPIDGNWSGWSEYGKCSVTCGGGLKTRNRTCSYPEPKFGGKHCTGNDTLISSCRDNPCAINGNWTEWSSWNECSLTCGGGMKVRDRNCSNPVPQYGGDPCFGNTTNIETCNEDPCPIDGNWSGWSEWKECSVTCGGGLKTRNRTCSNPEPQFGGKYCTGNDTHISDCEDNPCPINGNWTEWSSWNECSVTCGGGMKVRDRKCSNPVPQYDGDLCFGNITNIESCNEDPCPINGNWSEWSKWKECSVTCGGGLKTRNRTCSNPEPQFGGKYCTGNDTNISNCADNLCPINGNWTEWSSWNECSVTCGGGMKVRDRKCSNPVPQYGGDLCFGNITNIESCNEDPCPIDGNWSGWSKWAECSVTCGGGLKTRNRTCSNPEPQFGGKYCTGNDTNISDCADNPCPINGNWTEWSSWNECSVTCGGGMKVRDRKCSNPVPQYGGDPCFGNTTNIESCNEVPCPIDGNWSGWSEWEECSVTCGGGLKTRNRTCSNPEPQFGGKYCTGNDTHISNCADNPCPINGNWTKWSSWNECSVTCGGGMKVRDRKCSNPVLQYGGDPCFGNTTNIESCHEDPCPIDGNWSGWSEWEECSVTCGGGLKTRNRTCSIPEPQFGGKYCTGNDTHISNCADNPCPIDGHWTEWSSWNECSITCGGGLKDRERTCSNPLPQYGGNPCVGNATTSETCNEDPCPINGNWTEWSNWSACPVSCGGGKHTRMRSCTNPKPQFGGDFCDGNNTESQSCNFHHCPIHGQWSSWSELSECDRSCGGGMQNKNRSCSNPKPEYGGKECLGKDNESIECNKHSCPVNGNWTTWSVWSECPVSCGGSRHTRTRSCTKPKPQYGGDECEGNKTETQICNTQHCPIDGQWSNWSDFTSCSETCGGGDHSRNRSCTEPEPKYGGQHCPGEENQTKNCNTHPCPINGNWTSWSEWSVCPVSCGGGRHSRSRSCTNPAPMYGGSTCKGNTKDNQLCNPQHCPIDGEWTSWTAWSVCSVTCGGGKSARTRSCSDPAPQYNGSYCSGQYKENRVCNTINCPVDGEWSEWMPWSTCTVSCGGSGFQKRKRDCTNPSAKYGGKDCNGNDAEIQDCGDLGCPGLLFTPIEEFEGASAVLAKCRIENFTSWQELEIAKNSREMVILQSKGIETSNLGSAVAVSNDIKDMYAEIQLSFNKFSCKDEGTYVCSVDRGYHRSADVIVKTPPVGKPVFDINTEIFGERSEQFSCTGNPGYPKGHLEFWVKFRNETEYQEYRFHSAVRTVTDKNCRRQETVQVDYFFPMRWNGAKIRCKAPDSEEYTEREIWLISEYYCESVPLFSTVRHPYTCKKYMRCLEDKVDVMECPEGLLRDITIEHTGCLLTE
ncbi:Adhesion G protein-coupled receptor B2,Coadhesin,Thrombospondin-1,Adhesion G protein-coupled receptor B1,Mucin-like protein,Hemicentin-1,Adhesion G protein-coupled receptor B3,Thrombospondin-2 [Mytilus coruscus]|uniref:Adhesion G protein-coupled receptor B2,Coadhesin,Thrombospondin-1,Adhesion G protein-coupled receptor B1,Mucin-like protein,Hemicentin-1,Adhesion G protein-coupled receptor B3,Thrombospondin-2 n=1 Tax=Mytilus coruscus TaxID=42192 RepID=A0A6J8EEH5_MYTCO|nr:Adhesion G protein-coupled receptor B2,Coadhesin,Thrombospondin-1,Adhesion G protein-coupled receptor B1,Mucin-like protein,Hemicentin-1,Adhesion G protein-coupled receptor B3,Thrombospondin-2 [Mytilus coruscus]